MANTTILDEGRPSKTSVSDNEWIFVVLFAACDWENPTVDKSTAIFIGWNSEATADISHSHNKLTRI